MLEEINSRFNDELKSLTLEDADNKIFNLDNPSNILLSTGIADKPIKLYGNKEKVRNYLRSHPSLIREQQITPDFTGNQR